ncbi:MAG: hypothetical protein HEQ37_09375 [Acidovorax sp.]|nr:hypothetical protein [Acidovorax sp.]
MNDSASEAPAGHQHSAEVDGTMAPKKASAKRSPRKKAVPEAVDHCR